MNNDDSKLTPEQAAQNDEVSKHESAAESNTDNNFKTNHANSDEDSSNASTSDASNEAHSEQQAETVKTWHNKNAIKRGIAMLGYGFIAGFVRVGITLIAVFQFFSLLFSEKPNQPLVKFGQNLNTYQYQINQFLTVNSEIYPFPFADWPDSAPEDFANSECASRS